MNTTDKNQLKGCDRIAGAVLRRIKEEAIEPRPRWHFLMKESVIWGLAGVSVIVGALAVAGLLFELRFAAWDLYLATHESLIDFIFDALPLVWVTLFGLLGFAVYQSVRHTRRGYRYSPLLLLAGSFTVSCVAGSLIFYIGAGRYVDEHIGRFMPLHQSLFERERMLWNSTEMGRLSGVVVSVPNEEDMRIEGPDGVRYRISVQGFHELDRTYVRMGDHVRIVGIPTSTPEVMVGCAIFIRPDDVLMRAHERQKFSPELLEKKILFARTSDCKDVRPFTRLLPKPSNGTIE